MENADVADPIVQATVMMSMFVADLRDHHQ